MDLPGNDCLYYFTGMRKKDLENKQRAERCICLLKVKQIRSFIKFHFKVRNEKMHFKKNFNFHLYYCTLWILSVSHPTLKHDKSIILWYENFKDIKFVDVWWQHTIFIKIINRRTSEQNDIFLFMSNNVFSPQKAYINIIKCVLSLAKFPIKSFKVNGPTCYLLFSYNRIDILNYFMCPQKA